MTNKKFFFALLVSVALLATSVLSGTIEPYSQDDVNPMCAKPGVLTHEAANMTADGGSVLSFDWRSSYHTSNGDSAPILVKAGNQTTSFKFLTWDDNMFTTLKEAECSGTNAMEYVNLINHVLLLKRDTDYFVCVLDLANPTNTVYYKNFTRPSQDVVNGFAVNVLPYFLHPNNTLYFLFGDGSDSAIYSYNIRESSPLSPTLFGTKFEGNSSNEVHGNHKFIYNKDDGYVHATDGWVFNNVVEPIWGGVVTSHRFRNSIVVLSLYNASKTTIGVAKFTQDEVFDLDFTYSSTIPFVEYGDDVSNFLVYGSNNMFWVHMTSDTNSFYTVKIEKKDLDELSISVGDIEQISLSGNKAVIFYDGKIMYWRIQSQGKIRVVYSANSTGITAKGEFQYKLTLKCFCASLRKLICYSSTLACMIIKKGNDSCLTLDEVLYV